MKAVILAGGLGTRLSEETQLKPKPMVEVGGRPLLWHLMKFFTAQGITEFIICLGYRGYVIKEFFANYLLHTSDITLDLREDRLEVHERHAEPWRITLVDTGEHTQTGGRLRRVKPYLAEEENFFFTYGDGLANIDLSALLDFHTAHGRWATVSAVKPPGRFGSIELDGNDVAAFSEKRPGGDGYINGGFFVLSPSVIDYIAGDDTPWESTPINRLVAEKRLMAFRHDGFWQPMDTLRDKLLLERLWQSGQAPWKLW